MSCREVPDLVEERIDRVLTQWRESPNLLGMARAYLTEMATVARQACEMLEYFDIDTAVGDQLTILGKVLGWPRCHCKGQRRPVFGFACFNDCGPPSQPIGGFCEAEWDCGNGPAYVEFCFTDDEMYRGFLKARIIALTGDYTRAGLVEAAHQVFGLDACILAERPGTVAIHAGRLLTGIEISIAHLYQHAMPVAPGIKLEIWHGNGPAFGFGIGWGGFCDGTFPSEITLN